MKEYKVNGKKFSISSGIVRLTHEQAKNRLHNLKLVGNHNDDLNDYNVVNPIEFKQGEIFCCTTAIPKSLSNFIVLTENEAEAEASTEAAEDEKDLDEDDIYIVDDSDIDVGTESDVGDKDDNDNEGDIYDIMDREELKSELITREITFSQGAHDATIRKLLREDDDGSASTEAAEDEKDLDG